MALANLEELQAAWDEWMVEKNSRGKLTQGAAWRRDNPGEWNQLRSYREGAAKPVLATRTGRQMVNEVSAWLEAKEGSEPEPQPPDPSQFGANLHDGYEWANFEFPAGQTTTKVTTNQELAAAINSGANLIDGGSNTFNPGQLTLPAHTNPIRELRNLKLTNSRIYKTTSGKWRIRNADLGYGNPEDNLKGSGGSYLDIDHCTIHHAPRQGILLYHSDTVLRNTRIHHNGTIANGNKDHGIYTAGGTKLLWYNCAHWANVAYQAQLYPDYHNILGVCNTLYGGITRGGVVAGGETNNSPGDYRLIGFIVAGSPTYGFERYVNITNMRIEDALCWQNQSGDYSGFTGIRPRNGDPKFVNPTNGDFHLGTSTAAKAIIDPSLHGLVPATDIDGKPRTTADAGCHAT